MSQGSYPRFWVLVVSKKVKGTIHHNPSLVESHMPASTGASEQLIVLANKQFLPS